MYNQHDHYKPRARKPRILRHSRPGMRMHCLSLRMPSIIIHMPVVMSIIVIISPPPHLGRGHWTLLARHRLQHPLQRVAVQTHAVLPVHVLGALGLAAPVGDVIVEHVVVVGGAKLRLPHHVYLGVVHGLGVGEHVVEVVSQRKPG